jgi:hypothetical protein
LSCPGLRVERGGGLAFCSLSVIGLFSYAFYLAQEKYEPLEEHPI